MPRHIVFPEERRKCQDLVPDTMAKRFSVVECSTKDANVILNEVTNLHVCGRFVLATIDTYVAGGPTNEIGPQNDF